MEQNQYRMYVDGNTVRKAEALPKDDRQERIRREREEQESGFEISAPLESVFNILNLSLIHI